jgi:hypothetical protein
MTVAEALAKIRQTGTVKAVSGKLRIHIPASLEKVLERAIETVRQGKAEALALLAADQPLPAAEPTAEELAWASAVFAQTGVRLVNLDGRLHIGIWSDLDNPAIRAAIATFHPEGVSVIYLDGPVTPVRYKLRRVPGEPVPTPVRLEMERSQEPWKVRSKSNCQFVPWPLAETKPYTVDPETGIRPIAEWGACCGRGFVSNARFGPNQLVIPRTNRAITRKWRALNDRN